jgi:hypothetical protein
VFAIASFAAASTRQSAAPARERQAMRDVLPAALFQPPESALESDAERFPRDGGC